MSWSDERVERLKTLYKDGLSASQIAADLGGVSRNAVIGKVHRLGLNAHDKKVRISAGSQGPRIRSRRAPTAVEVVDEILFARRKEPDEVDKLAKAKRQEAREAAAAQRRAAFAAEENSAAGQGEASGVTFHQLADEHCRWIIAGVTNDLESLRYCGSNPYVDNRVPRRPRRMSYCAHHCRVAYVVSK